MIKKGNIIIIALLILLILIIGIKAIFYFLPSGYSIASKYIMGSKLKYEFCTYNMPADYKFKEFYDSGKNEGALVIWQNEKTGQSILLLRLRQQLKLRPENIAFSNRTIHRTFKMESSQISEDIRLTNLIPFFTDSSPIKTPPDLEIRGFNPITEEGESFSTETTNVFHIQGVFKAIGFYKPRKGIYQYISNIFIFQQPMHGAFAVIRYQKTGDVIFAISYLSEDKKFNNEEFLNILKTIKFDTKPFEDPYKTFTYRYKYKYDGK